MMQQKPIFKKSEIVIEFPAQGLDLGGQGKYLTGKVEYVGEEQKYYEVGDEVLYKWMPGFSDKNNSYLIDYFDKQLLRFESEKFPALICKIE